MSTSKNSNKIIDKLKSRLSRKIRRRWIIYATILDGRLLNSSKIVEAATNRMRKPNIPHINSAKQLKIHCVSNVLGSSFRLELAKILTCFIFSQIHKLHVNFKALVFCFGSESIYARTEWEPHLFGYKSVLYTENYNVHNERVFMSYIIYKWKSTLVFTKNW